jgi:hypothetical protein
MEYEELEKPIQRGYKRHFELTESIRKNKQAQFFQGILNKINTIQYSPDKQFKKIRKKRIGRRKYRKTGIQKLQDLDERSFRRLLTNEEQLYFYPIEYFNAKARKWLKKYRFAEPWLFELRIRPNMLTKIQKHNWEAEKREKEISDYLEKYRLYTKIEKLKHRYRWDYDWLEPIYKMKNENPLKNVPLHEIMETYKKEKELWAYDQKN